MNLREIFYISNLLSISRVFLLIPTYFLLKQQTPAGNYWAIGVILLAAATDFWDGRLARRFHQESDVGRVIDPLADKICVATTAILLVGLRDLPVWYVVLLIVRDLVILLGGLFLAFKTKIVVESNVVGKLTVGALAVVIITYIVNIDAVEKLFLWLSVGMVAISSLFYLIKMVNLLRRK